MKKLLFLQFVCGPPSEVESSFDSFPCLIPMVTRMEHCTGFVVKHLERNTPIIRGREGTDAMQSW